MLWGTVRSPQRWLGAPSRTSRMSRRANLRASTSRKTWKHAVFDGRDRAVQIDVFANELGGDTGPCADRRPARANAIHAPEARFISEHDAQPPPAPGRSPPSFLHSIRKAVFLKVFCAARSRLG